MGLAEQQAQQRAFDRLGPKTRAALNYSPHDISATAIVKQFSQPIVYAGRLKKIALDDPVMDEHIAKYVADRIRDKFKAEPEAFKIEPRNGSKRAQRRHRIRVPHTT